ncbi:hypothetical protein MCAG_04695 [Micromonospora sp. ATCC 39149]|nr:hypothetical protein MCAG_04695 [Micromonospora sp. ATCC 39149]
MTRLVRGISFAAILNWFLAAAGGSAEIYCAYLSFVDRDNLWSVLVGWSMGVLFAWLIARRRGFSVEQRRSLMAKGILAIFIVMFVRPDPPLAPLRSTRPSVDIPPSRQSEE